jgi:DNA polymerase III epsilon subunit-like protein
MFSKKGATAQNVIKYLDKCINKFNPKDKGYFIAQNAKFDADFMHKFINTSYAKFGNYFYHTPIDVLQLAAYKFMKKKRSPKSFSLSGLATELGISFTASNLHGAEYDTKLTRKVFLALEKI